MNEPMPYSGLVARIGKLLQQGRAAAGRAVNTILVQTYWQIGRHIVEFEQAAGKKPLTAQNYWTASRKT